MHLEQARGEQRRSAPMALLTATVQVLRRFTRDTRAGATAIAAVATVVVAVGSSVFITDHQLLVDQRDVLKSAANAASIATSIELGRQLQLDPSISDAALNSILEPIARRYVELNLQHLPDQRLSRAMSTLTIDVVPRRRQKTVDVDVQADMGGLLVANLFPMFEDAASIRIFRVDSKTENVVNPIEVVLAIDVSTSMWKLIDGRDSCTQIDIERGCEIERARTNARISIVKEAANNLIEVITPDENNRIAIGIVPWNYVVRLDEGTAQQWADNGWAIHPTRRVYPQPYRCKGTGCTPPGTVEQSLATTLPNGGKWKGCLDSQRTGSVGTRARLVDTAEFFRTPSENSFAQAVFPAIAGSAYECMQPPLPDDFGSSICYHGTRHNGWIEQVYPPRDAQYSCSDDAPTMLPLSTDAQKVRDTVNALVPVRGMTYSALGVLWAQRMLDHDWKDIWGGMSHPVDPDSRQSIGMRKIIILLTDGEDTHCGFGNESCTGSELGYNRNEACRRAKEDGSEIFVIAAMHPDKVSSKLGADLRECSSETEDSELVYAFLNNETEDDLKSAFESIADQLRTIRRLN